jgi:predicted nucleic-acid-binding Zn-ribbon protein
MNRPIDFNLGLGKCPKCSKHSLKEVNEREVIGLTQCKMTGNKSVMSKKLHGVRCLLCKYSNINTMYVDSKGHRVA